MPLMVGNIVVLNSGSPPINGLMLAACYTRWNSRLRCCRTSPKLGDETKGARSRNRIDRGGLDEKAGQEFRRSPLPIFA